MLCLEKIASFELIFPFLSSMDFFSEINTGVNDFIHLFPKQVEEAWNGAFYAKKDAEIYERTVHEVENEDLQSAKDDAAMSIFKFATEFNISGRPVPGGKDYVAGYRSIYRERALGKIPKKIGDNLVEHKLAIKNNEKVSVEKVCKILKNDPCDIDTITEQRLRYCIEEENSPSTSTEDKFCTNDNSCTTPYEYVCKGGLNSDNSDQHTEDDVKVIGANSDQHTGDLIDTV